MVEVLKAHPSGLSEVEMRREMGVPTDRQAQFGRRRRELKRWYIIEKTGAGNATAYIFKGERETPLFDADVDSKTRAAVLRDAHGRCGMCGQTIEKHSVVLVVDHKIPRDWGGGNTIENLWALCEECNQGKKAHFASQDQAMMKKVMCNPSVHIRLGEVLKASFQKPVNSQILAFVADQDDWKKRIRDLRYLNWKIEVTRKKINGKVRAFYRLLSFEPWPENPSKLIQEFERDRAKRNRVLADSAEDGHSDT